MLTSVSAMPDKIAYEVLVKPSPRLFDRLYLLDGTTKRKVTCPIRIYKSATIYYFSTNSPCARLKRSGVEVQSCTQLSWTEAYRRGAECSVTTMGSGENLPNDNLLVSYILIGPNENPMAVRAYDISRQDSTIRTALTSAGFPIWEYYRVNNVICMSVFPNNDVREFLRRAGFRVPGQIRTLWVTGGCKAHIIRMTGLPPPARVPR